MTDDELRRYIGKNLQALRKAAGFKSAAAFAEFVGDKPTKYTEYEQGRRSMSLDVACTYADALNCSLDELGGRKFEKHPDSAESELVECYRSSTDERRETIVSIARDQAELSKK